MHRSSRVGCQAETTVKNQTGGPAVVRVHQFFIVPAGAWSSQPDRSRSGIRRTDRSCPDVVRRPVPVNKLEAFQVISKK